MPVALTPVFRPDATGIAAITILRDKEPPIAGCDNCATKRHYSFCELNDLETLEITGKGRIGDDCFSDLPKLIRVVFPAECEGVEDCSFDNLPLLEEIVFPDSFVKSVTGGVVIDNPDGETVTVTDMKGSSTRHAACRSISLDSGVYVVTLGAKSAKVIVR